jgi:FAD/FMN-containing dehydrogenase
MNAVVSSITQLLPAEILDTDPERIALYSQDVFTIGPPIGAIVRPRCIEEVQSLVAACRERGTPIVTRGGGMSYTSGYLATAPESILIDMTSMDSIVEVNLEDRYVTVEAGCSWQKLYEHLMPLGVRTPYWGTLSGRYATVGGSVSQNSIFWGSGQQGTAADNVLSVSVVTGTAELIETGAASQINGSPFMRHFGPDLTGVFLSDCGALGIKVRITLPLVLLPGAKGFTSFAFTESGPMLRAMAQISRESLTSECFGFDPYLQHQRMKRASLAADAQQLSGVIQAETGIVNKVRQGAKVALAGRRFMDEVEWAMFTISEGRTEAEAAHQVKRIRAICGAEGGKELPDSIPRIMAANPFGPVNNMVGAEGERWLPVHGLVPHSKGEKVLAAIEAVYERNRDVLEQYAIETGYLIAVVSEQITVLEPVFFWPDALNALHKQSLEPDHLARMNQFEAVPGAREAVYQIKSEVVDLLSAEGASHFQLGKAYHYRPALKAPAENLFGSIKSALDPNGIMNPGVLGF